MAVRTRTHHRSGAGVLLAITAIVVGLIVLGILLVLARANQQNMLVDFELDLARGLTIPFHGLFPRHDPDQNIVVNWGIAAVVYALIGGALARLARR
jgi:hypothetical protein